MTTKCTDSNHRPVELTPAAECTHSLLSFFTPNFSEPLLYVKPDHQMSPKLLRGVVGVGCLKAEMSFLSSKQ